MGTQEAKEFIKLTLIKNNIPESDLANYLNITPQTFNYMLGVSKKFDLDVLNDSLKFFKKRGVLLDTPEEKKSIISNLIMELNALSAHQLAVFGKVITSQQSNDKDKLLRNLQDFQDEFNNSIEELRELIRGNS